MFTSAHLLWNQYSQMSQPTQSSLLRPRPIGDTRLQHISQVVSNSSQLSSSGLNISVPTSQTYKKNSSPTL